MFYFIVIISLLITSWVPIFATMETREDLQDTGPMRERLHRGIKEPKDILLTFDTSPLLNKCERETLVQNLIRQKLFYLEQVKTQVDIEFSQQLSYLEKQVKDKAILAPAIIQPLQEFEKLNQALDTLANQFNIHWPAPQKPFADNFEENVKSYVDKSTFIETSTGYNINVVLANPQDPKSVYAVRKKGGSNERFFSQLFKELDLNAYQGGSKMSSPYYERFVKLYPFERAVLSADLKVLNFCDQYADEYGEFPLSKLSKVRECRHEIQAHKAMHLI